jgi:hypothetical protein
MDMRLPYIIGIATAILSGPGGAMAQAPPWAVGTWKGAISNLRNDPSGPERVLVIEANGTCRWDYAAKADAPSKAKSCAVTSDAVNILTSGNATVQLQHKNGKLDGTFQARSGTSFHVSLTKQ